MSTPLPKTVVMLNQTIATDATSSSVVDRLGFDYAIIDVTMRAATATNSSAKWTVLKLQDSDDTNVSNAANISGYIGTTNATTATGTAAEFAIPANNNTVVGGGTSQAAYQTIKMLVPLQGRKRYLFLLTQANASHQTAVVVANLFRAEQAPTTTGTASTNVAALVTGVTT